MNRDQVTIEIVTRHYLICALWSSYDDEGEPLDSRFDLSDISNEAKSKAREDVAAFLELLAQEGIDWTENWNAEQMGHDFWLTRNGHGAGFWDRHGSRNEDAHAMGKRMSELVGFRTPFPEIDLYVGDDGKIYT